MRVNTSFDTRRRANRLFGADAHAHPCGLRARVVCPRLLRR